MNEIDDGCEKCPACGQNQNVSTPPHRLMPHTLLSGRYIIGAAKGEGGFGITYIGRDTRLDRTVAIKEYYPSGLVNRNSAVSADITETQDENGKDAFLKGRERFLTEAKLLARFSGEPGIVNVLDFFVENNTAYIVMEYLDGMSLANKLKASGTMSVPQVIEVMMPVMLSLEKVHKQGLIHRDISPSNIMILQNTVKLIDFGAARQASREGGKSLSLMLKPGYAPEEQYRSKGVQGPWTDIYALCATMYKCITGITPDEANDRLHKDELKAPSKLGIDVDAGFEAALMKGLSVLQENRYQSIEELLKDIRPFAASAKTESGQAVKGSKFAAQEDPSTRFAAEQPDIQRQPVLGNAFSQPVQPQWNAPPQVPTGVTAQPQWNAPPQVPTGMPAQPQWNAPPKAPTGVPTQPQWNAPPQAPVGVPVQPQRAPQPPVLSNEPAYDIDKRVASRVKERKRRKTFIYLIVFAVLALVAIIGLVIYLIVNGNKSGLREGEKLEAISFNPNDSGLNFYISNNYVSFKKTVVTPEDISKIKSRDIAYVHFTECQIPQETMDVIWEIDEDLYSIEFEKCKGFDDLSSLTKMPNLHSLNINQCDVGNDAFKNLDFSKQEKLNSIELTGIPSLSDISFLKTAGTITHVSITYCDVSDFSPVMELTELYSLKIENCKITDISPIKDTKARYLSTVSFSGNQIKDVSALKGMDKIYDIDLSSNELTSLKDLADNKEILFLNVNHNKLTSLSGLEQMIRLKKLECSNNEITDLGGITNCTVLEYVNINKNKISDITLLSKSASKLKTVLLDDNQVSDLSPLKGASNMKYLTFNNNKISDISVVKDFKELSIISGDKNSITSIDALKGLISLTTISFAHNKITDMAPIKSMSASKKDTIDIIDLSYNQIKKVELTSSRKYEGVFLFSNPITSVDEVKDISGMNIAVTYYEGMNVKELSKGYFRLTVVDCPLDKRMAIEQEVGRYSVTFCTAEEKEKDNDKKKAYIFERINS